MKLAASLPILPANFRELIFALTKG